MDTKLPPNPDDGRPPEPRKLTDTLIEAISRSLLRGAFRSTVCKRLGFGQRSMDRWMSLGKRFPDGIYGRLRRAVLAAEAVAEERAIARVLNAGKDDAKYLCWWLERKYPQRWGQYRGELGLLKKRIRNLEKVLGGDGELTDPVVD